ncbi:hypothetical protein PVAP13_6NG193306 [Panicum virgatum]|uniref:Ubiquitin-like protease family profile domain-containing protein n=1 Tax=Panicum virgatum TaxID=38727 RepID=A0A8T0QXI3_PANVG|nr:hypothetical protein PVAP13_6NG193306 [Panicum virgatum]
MVPMLHRGHWILYVVNLERRCIDIYDSNPYGPEMGAWCKVMMTRLNRGLLAARPNCGIPKFGKWKIDISPHCRTMKAGSKDCGFFVMRFIQLYDYTSGGLFNWDWPEDDGDLRSLLLQYLIFHPLNQLKDLPPEIERFRPPRV